MKIVIISNKKYIFFKSFYLIIKKKYSKYKYVLAANVGLKLFVI